MSWLLVTLTDYKPLIDFLTLIFVAVYVIYTKKTFQEIKKQTDLQSAAFLVVASGTSSNKVGDNALPREISDLYAKWRGIVQANVPAAVQADRYIYLILRNKGRSDIVWWRVTLNAIVDAGPYLRNDRNVSSETCIWSVEHRNHQDIIEEDSEIQVAIAKVGVFPSITLHWSIEYQDMRDARYTRFAGDDHVVDVNALANPTAAETPVDSPP